MHNLIEKREYIDIYIGAKCYSLTLEQLEELYSQINYKLMEADNGYLRYGSDRSERKSKKGG